MFTAVVLVCLAGELKEPSNCFTYTNELITESREECAYSVMRGIELKLFEWEEPDSGERWEPVDWFCINWNGKRV